MKEVRAAAKTIVVMCADYLMDAITEETFVNNLGIYAKACRDGLEPTAPETPEPEEHRSD